MIPVYIFLSPSLTTHTREQINFLLHMIVSMFVCLFWEERLFNFHYLVAFYSDHNDLISESAESVPFSLLWGKNWLTQAISYDMNLTLVPKSGYTGTCALKLYLVRKYQTPVLCLQTCYSIMDTGKNLNTVSYAIYHIIYYLISSFLTSYFNFCYKMFIFQVRYFNWS